MSETPVDEPTERDEEFVAERRAHAARALGMKEREITSVGERDPQIGGELVEMFDGTKAVVHDNGLVTVFVADHVEKLSPVAHALNPMVQFVDLAKAFGPQVARGTDAEAVVAELAAVVERDKANTEPVPPVLPPVVEPVEPVPPVESVPDGSAKAVLEWVGDDVERARLALTAEGARADGPRAGLSKDLTAILAAAENPGGGDA